MGFVTKWSRMCNFGARKRYRHSSTIFESHKVYKMINYCNPYNVNLIILKFNRHKDATMRIMFTSQYEEYLLAAQTLRKQFIRFNKFIRENKEKTERAQRKVFYGA